MRVWDVSPGYLSRQRLLGEHRELHGLASILANDLKGYSRHPETRRWVGCLSGLTRRHAWLVAEMQLRGYRDRTPLVTDATRRPRWPTVFVTAPADQFALLREKYAGRERGRIAIPSTTHELWAQHKYSVMARDPAAYRSLGRRVARLRTEVLFDSLALELVTILRHDAPAGRLATAIEHMWGYVRGRADPAERRQAQQSPRAMLRLVQAFVMEGHEPYLLASTALSDLAVFVDTNGRD